MKRYLLFCSKSAPTEGGWDDFEVAYDKPRLCEATFMQILDELQADRIPGTVPTPVWAHIVDLETGKKVKYWTEDLGWCAVVE
jgi:hypothetical protein